MYFPNALAVRVGLFPIARVHLSVSFYVSKHMLADHTCCCLLLLIALLRFLMAVIMWILSVLFLLQYVILVLRPFINCAIEAFANINKVAGRFSATVDTQPADELLARAQATAFTHELVSIMKAKGKNKAALRVDVLKVTKSVPKEALALVDKRIIQKVEQAKKLR
jgi:hypothetical protein